MAHESNMDPQETMIQAILAEYLTSQRTKVSGEHLDHDTLASFTEGNLSERESIPVVSHLVECSFCRHITSELIRLDLAFAGKSEMGEERPQSVQPSKISEVLSGLMTKMFGSTENAVFAHHDDGNKDGETETEEKKEES